MLNVQNYLLSGKTLDDLKTELGIEVKEHDTLPLVILNYSQIDSPKTHPIVRECRGLVLEKDTWYIVAKAFPRFFNWGELADEMPNFNWGNFTSTIKEDGSIVIVYWYAGEWRINTRGSFADSECGESGKSWDELIRPLLGEKFLSQTDYQFKRHTFVFEFCSEHNKVVRHYAEPTLFLLGMFDVGSRYGAVELPIYEREMYADFLGLKKVGFLSFRSLKEIEAHLDWVEVHDPTFEGVVVCDNNLNRWKIKNRKYLALHRMWGNCGFTAKNLLPFVLSGENDELLTYFPEAEVKLDVIEEKVEAAFDQLLLLWNDTHKIADQKEFALSILNKSPFTGVLFKIRKEKGDAQTVEDLRHEWLHSEDLILKKLF